MAKWSKNKVEPDSINKGNEFTKDNNFAIDELNAIVNNSFYASNKAKEALDKANDFIVTQRGTSVTLDGSPQSSWSADGVEHIETIYNKNNPQYSQLAGIDYSGGIGSNMVNNNEVSDGKVEVSHNISLTKYKHIRFIFDFGVQRLMVETYPISYLDRSYFTGFGGGQPWELVGNSLDFVSIQIVNNSSLILRFRRFSPSTNSISVLNSESVLLERIEGVY